MTYLKTTIFTFGLLALLPLSSTPSYAEDGARVSPLHIKMSPQNVTSHKNNAVNIQTSSKQSKKPKMATNIEKSPIKTANKAIPIEKNAAKPARVDVKDILRSVSCKKRIQKTRTIKLSPNEELARSLRGYLKAKNQSTEIIDTLHQVSQETGADFQQLIITAMIESDLGRVTISSKSTARGVYQFIEPTWLVLMKRYGNRIGYQSYADAITFNAETHHPEVKGGIPLRQKILDLRYDNRISALLKTYQAQDEKRVLARFKNGQNITVTDHYIAHMLGLSLARTFYKLKQSESDYILAHLKDSNFRQAVQLNRSFFYDEHGRALNAAQAYVQFDKKISEKFDRLKQIQRAHTNNGVLVKGPSQCPSDNHVQTVSADAILSHNITPLPKSETIANSNARDILSQVSSYAKTVKVKMVPQQE